MTINTQSRSAGPYAGNGSASAFPFQFKVFQRSDVLVQVIVAGGDASVLLLDLDYTVTLNADQNAAPGGTVLLATPLAVGVTLTLMGNLPLTQPARLTNLGGFFPQTIEDALDRLTILIQQSLLTIGRTIYAPELGQDMVLPAAAVRAGRILGFDANGTPIAVLPTPGDATGLALDLASSTSGSKGSGQLGFKASLAYAAGTTGAAIQAGGVTPTMFGAIGNGVADDTAALQAWAASPLPKVGEPKTFKVAASVVFGNSPSVDGRGMVIDASAGGAFTNASVVNTTGALTALPGVSGALTLGQQVLTFAGAHGLAAGDVFVLYNPTNSSWSSTRTYYREGEFCRVAAVVSATQVQIEEPLWSAYAAGSLQAHKLTRHDVQLRGMTILAPTAAAVVALRLSLATRVRLDAISAPASNYIAIYTDRCYDVELRGCTAITVRSAVADSYGLMLGNTQRARVFGGTFYAPRGAFDVGGDDYTGCVPNRDIILDGASIANDPALNFPACDLHGNLHAFTARKCRIRGGASWAGVDNEYLDCDIDSPSSPAGALIVGGSEWFGGQAVVRGGSLRTKTAASTSSVVRIVSNASAKADTTLVLQDVADIQAGANTIYALIEMQAGGTAKANARIDGANFTNSAALTQVLRVQGAGGGGDGDFLIVDRVNGAPAGAYLYIAANGYGATVKCRLMTQTAYGSVVMNTSSPQSSINPLTWRYSYGSKVPKPVGDGIDTPLIGTKRLGRSYRAINAATGVLDVFTTDNTNAPSAATVSGYLTVGLNEV